MKLRRHLRVFAVTTDYLSVFSHSIYFLREEMHLADDTKLFIDISYVVQRVFVFIRHLSTVILEEYSSATVEFCCYLLTCCYVITYDSF
jgi:hypothetical protein